MQAIVGARASVEAVMALPPYAAPSDAPIVALMNEALLAADPEATGAPMMITPGTDAKALAQLGILTYGFARCAWTPTPRSCPSSMPTMSGSR
jgi:acetylornithine deacetylase/succinyl-diaminopimelate desuccinylase-like protein